MNKRTTVPFTGRRRVRSQAMADELDISARKFRELQTLGMPCTQVQGIIWFEPDVVHAWLDKFSTKGAPGIKRVRGYRKSDKVTQNGVRQKGSDLV